MVSGYILYWPEKHRSMTYKILIIEDTPANMKLFNDLLQNLGYHTIKRSHGLDLEETLETQQPDLLLLDIQLPHMSGTEIAAHIRKNAAYDKMPILAVSAHAMPGDREEILACGCNAYLPKPLDLNLFIQTLQQLLPEPAETQA